MGNLLSSRFETTLRPTVPARSVAPITAAERGKKSDSRPARVGAAVNILPTGDNADGFATSLKQFLALTRMQLFVHTLSDAKRNNLDRHFTHDGTVSHARL
jgi:hypothetical protein